MRRFAPALLQSGCDERCGTLRLWILFFWGSPPVCGGFGVCGGEMNIGLLAGVYGSVIHFTRSVYSYCLS